MATASFWPGFKNEGRLSVNPEAEIALVTEPLEIIPQAFLPEQGAEVCFLGVVRGMEEGRLIFGIRYTAYESMALGMLHALHVRALEVHGPHQLVLKHRLGFVSAEEPSIIIRVRTKHSAASFDLCRWYLDQVKKTVPIWKEMVADQAAAAVEASNQDSRISAE